MAKRRILLACNGLALMACGILSMLDVAPGASFYVVVAGALFMTSVALL